MCDASLHVGRAWRKVLVCEGIQVRRSRLNRWAPLTYAFAQIILFEIVDLLAGFEVCLEGEVTHPAGAPRPDTLRTSKAVFVFLAVLHPKPPTLR